MQRLILLVLCGTCLGAEPTTKCVEFHNADEILALFPVGSFPATNEGWTDVMAGEFHDARYDKVLDHTCRLVFTLTETSVIKSRIFVGGHPIEPRQVFIDGFMPKSLRVKGMRVKVSAICQCKEDESKKSIAMVEKCERNKQAVVEGTASLTISRDKDGRFLSLNIAPEMIEHGK